MKERRIPRGMTLVTCRICGHSTPTYTPKDPVCRSCRKRVAGELIDAIPPRHAEPAIDPSTIPF